jgi:UDP-N-acetylglucosamine--dolichyl-phosphate N-acetylglucosaminephosphotransferase
MNPLLLIPIGLSLLTSMLLTQRWIPIAHRAGLVGVDMNKYDKPEVANLGGICAIAGIVLGLLLYIGIYTFVWWDMEFNLMLFASIATIMIIAMIGFVDDILGWKLGIPQWQKPLLTIPAALPLMVVNAGVGSINIPIIGMVNLGILYPLLIVTIGIVGASNGFNMLAGFNGLEAGMGIIIISAMSIVTYALNAQYGTAWVAVIGAITVAALVGFIVFNWYPAKVFCGNSFTYAIGSIIGIIAILGHTIVFALLLFVPYYIDFILGMRGRMKVEAFGIPNPDGTLEQPDKKMCDTCHLAIAVLKKLNHGKATEVDVVMFIFSFEIILVLIGFWIYLLPWYI